MNLIGFMRRAFVRIRASARLVKLGISLAQTPDMELIERSIWERAWIRFSSASLIGLKDAKTLSRTRARCFFDACILLSSPHFTVLGLDRRAGTILALHDTLMSAPSQELVPIAELGLRQFRRMLEDPSLTVPQAMGVFDALHSMYFAGVSDVLELRRFDGVVPLFEGWLLKRYGTNQSRHVMLPKNRPLTIAYLLHTAHFDRGNAVSPLIVLLAKIHAQAPDRRVFLYLVQYVEPGFPEQVAGGNFQIRLFPQGRNYERIDAIAAAMREDLVDVVITEQNRAVAAALFSRRVAPLQMWLDTGFPFWSLKSLDWTFSPNMRGAPDTSRRISGLFCHHPASMMQGDIKYSEVERIRKTFPAGVFVLGVFARLVKLNDRVFDLLNKLLASETAFQLLIVGTGDAVHVREFVAQSAFSDRIHFLHENVDLRIYGHVVDVMCDTFPFIGGHACREVGAQGTPVVSMLGTAWDGVLHQERSAELLARDHDAYIAIVRRLFHDAEFLRQQKKIALQLFADRADPDRTIADLEAGIGAAVEALKRSA